jgi:very-short-patch-repair endonuclease
LRSKFRVGDECMYKPAGPEKIARARQLRREATPFEKRLWRKLRGLNALGFRFRQQAPFDNYILDFVEHDAKLVIELDGAQHGEAEHLARDARRDAFLKDQGYQTLRFWNSEVKNNLDGMVERIAAIVRERQHRPPPDRLRRSTSPQRGR